MIFKTTAIDQAAFLRYWGAKLIKAEGKYLDNTFVLEANRLLLWYEKHIGWIPYKQFCGQRKELKQITRQRDGLPAHFTAKRRKGFTLQDLAYVKK